MICNDIAWTEKLPKFTPHRTSVPVMHASKMKNYQADPERFPHGLDGCIGAMKEYGLKIGIWHPTTGYWAGIEPYGEADRKLKSCTRVMESGWILPDLTDKEKAYGFFNTTHKYLSSAVRTLSRWTTRAFYVQLTKVLRR